jgi:predicted transcriptional regulator
MTTESHTTWTFLTNYGHVLLVIAAQPDLRLRDIAEYVGITERAAQRIVRELVDEGYLTRRRVGRRNEYQVERNQSLRHTLQTHRTVGDLVDMLQPTLN